MTSTLSSTFRNARSHRFGLKLAAIFGLGILALAGCSSSPSRPTTPVYSGKERPDPTRPPRPDQPTPGEQGEQGGEQPDLVDRRGAVIPRHLRNKAIQSGNELELTRVAVLLPFSSTNANARKQAEGVMEGIEAALFNAGMDNIILLPKDTAGVPATAEEAAKEALADGATLILGPLFNHNITPVNTVAAKAKVPVLSFGTDPTKSGNGAYLVTVPAEEEVARIVDWASLKGVTQFAMFGPDNAYGRRMEKALEREALWRGGRLIKSVYYTPGDLAPTAEAQILSATVREADKYNPGKVAVLIPDRGNQLRAVAPLLQYYDVNVDSVKLLGTGLWNDPEVWREPTLAGGVFAAPPPETLERYQSQHVRFYGEQPPSLSSLGYDAGLMALAMIASNTVSRASIERMDGFLGTNGLFRFRADGTPERSLAVLEVKRNGTVTTIDPARRSFAADGS